jgi:anti-anti-sigma factor
MSYIILVMLVVPEQLFVVDSSLHGGHAVMQLWGELDCASVEIADLEFAMVAGAEVLTIDLRGLAFMDAAGLHLLLRASEQFPALRVVRGRASVHRLFELTDLVRRFDFVDGLDIAA